MKNSKKGITLVELVICCAIIVMLGGACTAVLASGSTIFNHSAKAASAQLDSDVLQTHMINLLPSAKNIRSADHSEAKDISEGKGTSLFLDENGTFIIRNNGSNTTIHSVESFSYEVLRAGTSDTAKAQLKYAVKFYDGSILEGGFLLTNVTYTNDLPSGTRTLSYGDGNGESLILDEPKGATPSEGT